MPAPLECPWSECCKAVFDPDLPPSERQRYEQHLESCATCQERLEQAEEQPTLLPGNSSGRENTARRSPHGMRLRPWLWFVALLLLVGMPVSLLLMARAD